MPLANNGYLCGRVISFFAMTQVEDKYISLLTDFGFKRIFGTAMNKDLLISFLNSLFDGEQTVSDVHFLNGENVGDQPTERKAIFDVYCENDKGEKFIVEMQNAYQVHFKDRTLYYSTFPIREQAKRGDWDFELRHVYVVAVLNFTMHEEAFDEGQTVHTVQLCDTDTGRVFYPKLSFKYVELARFDKSEDELETMRDKWCYVLRNLQRLTRQPKALQERVFERLFKEANIATFTPDERKQYEGSVSAYRDIKNSISTAKALGRAQGKAEGRDERSKEIARNMLAMGMNVGQVAQATGLDEETVSAIRA